MNKINPNIYVLPICRFALAFVYIWFGWPKLVGLSPADPVVEALLSATLPFIPFSPFEFFLGAVEVTIGVLWIHPKTTLYAFWITMLHMLTTFGTLVFTIDITWNIPFLVATLPGQYILKNVLLIATAYTVYASHKSNEHTILN